MYVCMYVEATSVRDELDENQSKELSSPTVTFAILEEDEDEEEG